MGLRERTSLIVLFAYGKRHRSGKQISTAMAESAVNQAINSRMRKRQQMRWTRNGGRLIVQVRCAVINGDPAERFRASKAASVEEISPEDQLLLAQLKMVIDYVDKHK